jgi:hypothetical protein
MKICEIYPVKHAKSFQWKWRHVAEDGRVRESHEQYALYYECMSAARASGYEPQLKRVA